MKENAANNTTELVFILDRSGSMCGYEGDTVGGFNATLAREKERKGEAYVTTVLFSDRSTRLHDRLPIASVKPLSVEDYRVGGCTALLDAVGEAVRHIGNIHKYARPEDVPAHTLFVISTDGLENASRHFTRKQVQEMIERQKSRYGWEFIFLGAGIDAVAEAESIGIAPERAASYRQDKRGIARSYEAISCAVEMMRCDSEIAGCWSDGLRAEEEDGE